MSTRALRKLEESTLRTKEKKEEVAKDISEEDEGVDSNGDHGEFRQRNLFALLNEQQDSAEDSDKETKKQEQENIEDVTNSNTGGKKGKKKRKRNKKAKENSVVKAEGPSGEEDDFDNLLAEFAKADKEKYYGLEMSQEAESSGSDNFQFESDLFRIDHRLLNPENEMKKIFGTKVNDPELRRLMGSTDQNRRRGGVRKGKLVQPKNTWPMKGLGGLSMSVEKKLNGGVNLFTFEHGQSYQEAQILFWEAVDSMNPDAFVAILQAFPYHLDTLLQLSEVVRQNEDYQQARDFVERALYGCESGFHPLFNLTQFNSRLDYRQQENRSFFIALFRFMSSLAQRGCFTTGLEFCKLIYSLDPSEDPLGMMLMIDFFALRARQFDYLLNLYRGLEVSRNLSQLPNFAFSVPLGLFLKWMESVENGDQETADNDLEMADEMLQNALKRFPTVLLSLLDKCSVEPDKNVAACQAYSLQEQYQDSSGLKQLISLYVARTAELWKDPKVMGWLERNVQTTLPLLNKGNDTIFKEYRKHRRTRYQGIPRNVLRHVLMSELKDATVNLPPDLRNTPIMSFDPLPPKDSKCRYKRPDATQRLGNDGFLTAFLRSILPSYDVNQLGQEPELMPGDELEGAVGGAPRNALHGTVDNLMQAMRGLLNEFAGGVEMQPPPREDGGAEEGDRAADEEWDMD